MILFYEWVTRGAQIGVEAFFALFVFLLFCAALLGMWLLGTKIFEKDK